MLHRIKVRVGNQVAGTELAVLERVRAAEICDVITENAALISDRGPAIASLTQSLVIMAFSAVYIAWLSLPALALVALVCGVGAALFVGMRRDVVAYNQRSARIRVTFLERLMDLLAGFKEIQFSRHHPGFGIPGHEAQARCGVALIQRHVGTAGAQHRSQVPRQPVRPREIGVGPEVRVGICLERSLELVVAILGFRADGPTACIHELFAEQVERTPDAAAVVFAGASLTYAELYRGFDLFRTVASRPSNSPPRTAW